MIWDAFISHASEDKLSLATPLADLLTKRGLRVWLDARELGPSDSIPGKISEGLRFSRHAISIISNDYLRKSYARAEFDAIVNRNIHSPGFLLPVLHHFEYSQLTIEQPLVASIIALSTSAGVSALADHICDRIKTERSGEGLPGEKRYFESFELPAELISRSMDAIETLRDPETWPALRAMVDLADNNVWMGTDSPALIGILFDLYRPFVFYREKSYILRRSFGELQFPDKQRLILLETAFYALTNEMEIALCDPAIDYNPRTPFWRKKRAEDPAKYWWQGLTVERFDEAMKFFVGDRSDAWNPKLVGLDEFSSRYLGAYRGSATIQRPIGLLANALYGFTPRERPVFWRLLHVWIVCHRLIGSGTLLEKKISTPDISNILQETSKTPLEGELYEPLASTFAAVRTFFDLILHPRLAIYLGGTRY